MDTSLKPELNHEYLNSKEAAIYLNTPYLTLGDQRRTGLLMGLKHPDFIKESNRIYYLKASLDEWLKEHQKLKPKNIQPQEDTNKLGTDSSHIEILNNVKGLVGLLKDREQMTTFNDLTKDEIIQRSKASYSLLTSIDHSIQQLIKELG